MTLVLELPDAWKRLLGLDSGDPVGWAREMLVIEGYREGRLSRGHVTDHFKVHHFGWVSSDGWSGCLARSEWILW
jgi:hypothetical protein